jgi:superfamily II DNA or RNA helicase
VVMPTTVEGAAVSRLFDPSTFARGCSYASSGAVIDYSFGPEPDTVVGEVQGRAALPYQVEARVTRSPSGLARVVDGECSCPAGWNCKHVVALLLVSGAADAAPSRSAGARSAALQPRTRRGAPLARTARKAPAWQIPLLQVVDGSVGTAAGEESGLALQFQLVTNRRKTRTGSTGPGIEVRPVVRSPSGNWVRTGTSWSKLDYSYGAGGASPERMALLRELRALNRLSSGYSSYQYPSHGPDIPLWLEDVSSRRLWDLLAEAKQIGIPLVSSGPAAGPVRLVATPATVGLDLLADGPGLRMQPQVQAGGERVALESCVMIGSPPHGLAWWREGRESKAGVQLSMAPFSSPLHPGQQALIAGPAVEVPRRHQERFWRDFYPRLARSLAVVSSDESVELPPLPPLLLVLTVRHRGTRCVASWGRALEGSPSRDSLWEGAGLEPELESVVAATTETVRSIIPAMVEPHWDGDRLAASVELSGMDAARLVTDLLPLLSARSGLLVEQEGDAPDYREAEGSPVVSLEAAGRGVDGDWFDLRVEVSIDGEQVVFQDLFVALAEGHSHLLLPSGTYFSLDRPELVELAELIAEARALQDRDSRDPDHIRLSRFQAGLWEDLQRLGVVTAQAGEWETAVRALAEAGDGTPAELPDGVEATLRPYQRSGYEWLAFLYSHRLGGILADDMGLGKTLQAISLICRARQDLGVDKPFLVVAPTSVVENWAHECRQFAPELRVSTVAETESRRWVSLADLADKSDVVVCSYTLFRLEYDDYEAVEWAGLFLDEAQFVKNPRSIAYARAKALPAPFKVAMTGTPIENNLRELWALLSITAPGLFPRADRFADHYSIPIERKGDTERLAQLRRRIRPLMLRRTKDQVASELPDKQEHVLELELTTRHRRLYQARLQRERQKILGLLGDMDRHQIEILRSLTVLRQAALDMALVDDRCEGVPSTKLDLLAEMLAEIVADGHRVLVFSQFTRFLSKAAARAKADGIGHCYLDGRTRKRDQVIARFRSGEAPVFFISLKAGGFGLNLTEADYCILLDPWWNPATEAQAVDRVHRIGQTRKVMVYRMVAKDTIEEKVMALKAKKAALFDSVMSGGGFETARLSAADIRALLD